MREVRIGGDFLVEELVVGEVVLAEVVLDLLN